ncbi:MAG: PKD domain-containing protein [Chitinophagaceae bacterium]|nr:PKD domain-containing protein [Chitinophagaceae bacterium]
MKISLKILRSFIILSSFACCVNKVSAQVEFIQNKGQWDNRVEYRGDFSTGSFFLENQGFTVAIHRVADLKMLSEQMHGHNTNSSNMGQPITINSHAYKVKFLGGNSFAQNLPDKIQPYHNNYYVGSDQSKWTSDCKIAQAVSYQNIYPNVDVRYYSDAGKLKYDIIVHPGGDIDKIAMQYSGVDKLEVKNKELMISTSVGAVKELYPYSYQVQDGQKKTVNCKYVVKNNIVRFKVTDYDPNSTIVIDPTLIFSSFSGSTAENWGFTATPAPDGSFYAGGIAFGSGFPVSAGAYQTVFGGGINEDQTNPNGYDISIIKFSANGSNRLFATYIGGSRNEQPHSMICDAQGNLFIAGRSNSNNYPGTLGRPSSRTDYDIVITKLNANGTAALGAVAIGGSANDGVNIRGKYIIPDGVDATRRNYGDDARSEIILDAAGNVLLASCTQSSDFPVTPGTPIQAVFGGGRQDGVVLKFNSNLSSVLFSSFFGGTGDDACFVLSQDPLSGDVYVAGATTGPNLPGNKVGVMQDIYQGGATDGFITQIKNDGSAIVRTTFQGTPGNDMVYGIQFDKKGFPYIMGTTTGNWPVVSATFSNANSKQFISKLKPDLSPTYIYSTIFGTASSVPNLSPVAFLVDRCENVYVSGWGGGINIERGYPSAGTSGLPEVTPLSNIPAADGQDFYFFVLEKNAQSQLFGSHFGQNGSLGDHVDGGTSRFDANGVIYQAFCSCGTPSNPANRFPTTPGVWSGINRTPSGDGCNLAAAKIEMNFAGIGASVKATIDGVVDTIGCVPLTVRFTDTLARGKMYIWIYNDPFSTVLRDTTYAPNNSVSHTYNQTGSYPLMLISIDSATCNIADTAFVTVKVGNNLINADFSFFKLDSCNSLRYQFINQSVATVPNYTSQSFIWDFGDNTPKVRSGFGPINHTYASIGTYTVTLIVDDTTFCNAPDTAIKQLRISPNVKAAFLTPNRGCVPYTPVFKNLSLGGTDWIWEFGNGDVSTAFEPTYTYPTTGTFNVRLIAIDTSTCNKRDTSAYFTITVFPIPTANFSWTPNPPQVNALTRFTNLSAGASRYLWNFGDGESSTAFAPTHQYNATGTYRATLYAFNAADCVDSLTQDVPIIIVPLLDVPNAFTPGRFGENGIVKVKGFGIGTLNWKIFNRWGQVVFATSDRNQGWDGTFKGALQPMDVYTYTLDVEFTDGQKLRKTGDISLLR